MIEIINHNINETTEYITAHRIIKIHNKVYSIVNSGWSNYSILFAMLNNHSQEYLTYKPVGVWRLKKR